MAGQAVQRERQAVQECGDLLGGPNGPGPKAATHLAWRAVDAELAALTHDSHDDASLAGTRAEATSVRLLSFVAGNLSIEVEVTAEALLGQVVPPQPGQVELGTLAGPAQTVVVDEVGWFVIQPVPHAMFRLRLSTSDGVAVITQWVTL